MKNSLKELVKNYFNEEQKQKVEMVINSQKDRHSVNYGILFLAFDEKDTQDITDEEMKDFFGLDSVQYLSNVDWIIVLIITTLSKKLNKDVKSGYEDALVLCPSMPEFEYLVKMTEEHLKIK